MAEEPKSPIFDQELYGVFLRSARQKAGYNRAEDFCKIVRAWTGVKINKEALYRIEKGVQPPTIEQLFAFGLILFHDKDINTVLNKTDIHRCATPYAEHLASHQGSLTSMPSYDGHYYDWNPAGEFEEFGDVDTDEEDTSFIDEYYLDQLKTPAEPIKEAPVNNSVYDEDIPF